MGILNPVLWIYCLFIGCVIWLSAGAVAALGAFVSTRIRTDTPFDLPSRVAIVFVGTFLVTAAVLFLVFLVVTRDVQLGT